jgi:formylglycine-generating enzyme required for sulfatase activity
MAGTGAAAPAFPWHVPGWVWVAGGMAALVLLAVGVAAIWPKPPPETPEPTKEPPGPALGDSRTRPADGMDMVYVPAGQFQMGSTTEGFDNEQPVHTVALDGFWIDQAEVTNEQYARCVEVGGCEPLAASSVYAPGRYKALARAPVVRAEAVFTTTVPISPTVVSPPTGVVGPVATLALRTDTPEPTATITPTSTPMPTLSITPTGPIPTNTPVPTHPAVYVTWYQAAAYCEWAGGRLPTEAEWEYAARGPQGYVYPWGYDAPDCDRAKYRGCVGNTVAVGSYPTGERWCGALDMAGNVWEWVADWYGPYPSGWQENPKGPASGDSRVLRGGSWRDFREVAHSSFRFRDAPDSSYPSYGFRCVVDADQSD